MNFSLLAWYARNSRPDQQPSVAEHSSSEEEQHLLIPDVCTIALTERSEHPNNLQPTSILRRDITCTTETGRSYICIICIINVLLVGILGMFLLAISRHQGITLFTVLIIALSAITALFNTIACCKVRC